MKPVSINAQHRIMYIPFVNVLNLFICIYNLNVVRISRKREVKCIAYLFGYGFLPGVIYSILYRAAAGALPAVAPLVYAAAIYLFPMIMGYGLIKFQIKYIFTDDTIKT